MAAGESAGADVGGRSATGTRRRAGLLQSLRGRLSGFAIPPENSLAVALFSVWLLLLLSGKNQGEAARLWTFITPWVAIAAAPLLGVGGGMSGGGGSTPHQAGGAPRQMGGASRRLAAAACRSTDHLCCHDLRESLVIWNCEHPWAQFCRVCRIRSFATGSQPKNEFLMKELINLNDPRDLSFPRAGNCRIRNVPQS
ncbi:MAG UNVERIFIED_CONTAM: hypothetical protein LVR18_23230 [Planctomycetaceae bacterium]